MANIVQITPCSGWFHVFTDDSGKPHVTPVGAWGLTSSGDVVGLIPVQGSKSNNEPNYPRLVTPPPVGGRYLHETDSELGNLKLISNFG